MKPEFTVNDMLNEWHQTKSISLGIRRIKKKKIPITDGRIGVLPPLSISNSLEQLPESKSSNNKIHQAGDLQISLTGRDDDVNNITIDINNLTQDSEQNTGRKAKSPTASQNSKKSKDI